LRIPFPVVVHDEQPSTQHWSIHKLLAARK
jgi:hypothetical protein